MGGSSTSTGSGTDTGAVVASQYRRSIPNVDGNRDRAGSASQALSELSLEYGRLTTSEHALLQDSLRNLDLGGRAHQMFNPRLTSLGPIPARPSGYNKNGKEVKIELNSYVLDRIPDCKVWQYDVEIGNGAEKRGFMKLLWECEAVRKQLVVAGDFDDWIWDGNKLAWSTRKFAATPIIIDVDTAAAKGRQPSPDKPPEIKHVRIKRTKQLDFSVLHAWLGGQTSWDVQLLESLTFLDHLMREGPSRRLLSVKRNFFPRSKHIPDPLRTEPLRESIGKGVEVVKGVYASIRPVHTASLKANLAVNIDVANACFFEEGEVWELLGLMHGLPLTTPKEPLSRLWRDAVDHRDGWLSTAFYQSTRKLHKVWITTGGEKEKKHRYMIKSFVTEACKHVYFTPKDGGKEVSVWKYWKDKSNPSDPPYMQLPPIETTRGQYIPCDKAWVESNQRCLWQLDEFQTNKMMKFAATLPPQRFQSIKLGIKQLGWHKDEHLKHYGLHISKDPTVTKGRVLVPPDLYFGGTTNNIIRGDMVRKGRWRIDGKLFLRPFPNELDYCVLLLDRPSPIVAAAKEEEVALFFKRMSKVAESHGLKMGPAPAVVHHSIPEAEGQGIAKMWEKALKKLGKGKRPAIVFVVLHSRSPEHYRLVKRQFDIKYGVASQCMLAPHIGKPSDQYISNVLLKVNAKLGGCTSRAFKPGGFLTTSQFDMYRPRGDFQTMRPRKLMIIGADVSHGPPGNKEQSLASITISKDPDCLAYMAYVNTNGYREEMISVSNWTKMFNDFILHWTARWGMPDQLLYVRDGVSERQYNQVLEIEVNELKRLFKQHDAKVHVPITVLIASKRHHVRFNPITPSAKDDKGNPVPGVVVESGVTHPFEFDWYMNPHSAIKGTCRPIHYHCIFNENQLTGPEMHQLIFEHSFQYIRSTTPVSLFPAVYYAHLAAKRAEAHFPGDPPKTKEEKERDKALKKEEKKRKKEEDAKTKKEDVKKKSSKDKKPSKSPEGKEKSSKDKKSSKSHDDKESSKDKKHSSSKSRDDKERSSSKPPKDKERSPRKSREDDNFSSSKSSKGDKKPKEDLTPIEEEVCPNLLQIPALPTMNLRIRSWYM